MAIALPQIAGVQFLSFVRDCATTARAIRDGQGDLTYEQINALQNNHGFLRARFSILEGEAVANAAVILNFLRTHAPDGPTTLAGWATGRATLDAAIGAWGPAVLAVARSLTASDLIEVQQRTLSGQIVSTIRGVEAIPGASASSLRSSQELANVIAALEALGA